MGTFPLTLDIQAQAVDERKEKERFQQMVEEWQEEQKLAGRTQQFQSKSAKDFERDLAAAITNQKEDVASKLRKLHSRNAQLYAQMDEHYLNIVPEGLMDMKTQLQIEMEKVTVDEKELQTRMNKTMTECQAVQDPDLKKDEWLWFGPVFAVLFWVFAICCFGLWYSVLNVFSGVLWLGSALYQRGSIRQFRTESLLILRIGIWYLVFGVLSLVFGFW